MLRIALVTKTSRGSSTTTGQHPGEFSLVTRFMLGMPGMSLLWTLGSCVKLCRLIFNHLEEALSSQRQGVATEEDASLPQLGCQYSGSLPHFPALTARQEPATLRQAVWEVFLLRALNSLSLSPSPFQ